MSKENSLNYTTALNIYFNGVKGLNRQALPFKCKCGEDYFQASEKDEFGVKQEFRKPIMSVDDCYRHIRKNHGEIIRK